MRWKTWPRGRRQHVVDKPSNNNSISSWVQQSWFNTWKKNMNRFFWWQIRRRQMQSQTRPRQIDIKKGDISLTTMYIVEEILYSPPNSRHLSHHMYIVTLLRKYYILLSCTLWKHVKSILCVDCRTHRIRITDSFYGRPDHFFCGRPDQTIAKSINQADILHQLDPGAQKKLFAFICFYYKLKI